MFPTADLQSGRFWAGFVLMTVLSIPVHELGHAVAGRLAGFSIAACGISFPRPFFSFRLRGTSFYLARPIPGGMTMALWEGLRLPAGPFIFFVAGGPVSNLILGGAALLLWHAGARSPLLAAAWYASALSFLTNVIPYSFTVSGARLGSDGMLILQAWRGTLRQWVEAGGQIRMLETWRDLCRGLGALQGEVYYTLHLAWHKAEVFDLEGAQETLREQCLCKPGRGLFAQRLEVLVRALVGAEAEPADASTRIEEAREAWRDDPIAPVMLLLGQANAALKRAEPEAANLAREALARAREAKDPLLETAAMALVLEADPPGDVLAAAREILRRRGASKPTLLMALNLTGAVTKILADRGEEEAARILFQEGLTRLTAIGRTLPPGQARARFVSRASSLLQGAVTVLKGEIPLYVPCSATEPSKAGSPGPSLYGIMGVACGLLGLLAYMALAPASLFSKDLAGASFAVAAGLCLLGLLFSVLCMIQKGKSSRWAWTGIVLNFMTIVPLGIFLVKMKSTSHQ